MDLMDFTIRKVEERDIPDLVVLMNGENWNHSEEYYNFCRQTFPSGYLVAVNNEGNIISHCGGTRVTKDVGFIGFYITKPEFRGKGIGRKVFNACAERLGDINIGLNSIKHRAGMYASGGFKIKTFETAGYIGRPRYKSVGKIAKELPGVQIRTLENSEISEVLEFDASISPLPRQELMKKWFSRPGMVTLIAYREGSVCGYLCLIKADEGYRVSPLYAKDTPVAQLLWKTAISQTENDSLLEVQTIADNVDANDLFSNTLALEIDVVVNYRLYTKEAVDSKLEYVYSMSTMDITVI